MTCQLYRHFGEDGELLYVGISLSAVARLSAHNQSATWANSIRRVEIQAFPDRRLAELAEATAIQNERPKHNIRGYRPIGSMDLITAARAEAPESEDVKILCDYMEANGLRPKLTRAQIQRNYRRRKKEQGK